MKIIARMPFLLCLLLMLTACSKENNHPTTAEVLDFMNGQTFAQDKFDQSKTGDDQYDITAVTLYANQFYVDSLNADLPFAKRSVFFKAGAYYEEYDLISKWCDHYLSLPPANDNATQSARNTTKLVCTKLNEVLKQSNFTYEEMAELLAGKSKEEMKAFMDPKPDEQ